MIHCCTYLPSNVRLAHVAAVLGRLVGCKAEMRIGTCYVKGMTIRVDRKWPEHVDIICRPTRGIKFQFCYEFESEFWPARRLIKGISNSFHLAMGKRLIDFFGGYLYYNEHDVAHRTHNLHVLDKEDRLNRPKLTGDFDRLQERILRLEPLTLEEVKSFKKFALSQLGQTLQ